MGGGGAARGGAWGWARALPSMSQRISSGRATACIWPGGGEAGVGGGRGAVKAWCQGGRAGGRRSPGGGTCTSVAAAASRPGRRAGPRARGALRKWRARRAGGAPRAVGGTPVRGCTRHSRGARGGKAWGGRGGGRGAGKAPPEQKTEPKRSLVPWETFYPKPWTSGPKGQVEKPRRCPTWGAERESPRRSVPSQPSSSSSSSKQFVLARPENQGRAFTVSGKPAV